MKNTIINILVFILMFNLIMIIFPEGKTQKYCKLTIKIFIFIYIINNIFFSGSLIPDELLNMDFSLNDGYSYERELNMETIDKDFIDLINKNLFEGEDVIKDVKLNFSDELQIKATVTLNRVLDFTSIEKLKIDLSEIFKINLDDIEIN